MDVAAQIPKVYCDRRIGNCHKYILSTTGPSRMFIPEEFKHCVVFLGMQKSHDSDVRLCGTAFLVSYPVQLQNGGHKIFYYLVTAAHVIKEIQDERSCDAKVYVRFNKEAGYDFLKTDLHHWVRIEENNSIDVAVCQFELSPEMAIKSLPFAAFATHDIMEREQLGIGDEIFIAGLFREHWGKKRNTPIIRVGNISALPEEDVHSKKWGNLERPYLIECRSIGGLSGSPVCVFTDLYLDPTMQDEDEHKFIRISNKRQFRTLYLLGLIHGHWDQVDSLGMNSARGESINMGIAIVIPCDHIVRVFDSPQLKSARDEYLQNWIEKHGVTPD